MLEAMNYSQAIGHDWQEFYLTGLGLVLFIGFIPVTWFYKRYIKTKLRFAFPLAVLCLAAGFSIVFHSIAVHNTYWNTSFWDAWEANPFAYFLKCFTPGLFIVFFVPFAGKLLSAWIYNKATDAEKTPGLDSVRAWLAPVNICLSVLISFLGWKGFAHSEDASVFLYFLAMSIGSLLVYPVVNTLISKSSKPLKEDQSAVQSKILDLLESGKISPHECTELLSAVYKPKAKPDTPEPAKPEPENNVVQPPVPPVVPSSEPPEIQSEQTAEQERIPEN